MTIRELPGTSITDATPNQSTQLTKTSEKLHVVWQFWRMNQMRSYHGAPAIVELGEIGGDDE